MLAMGLIKRLCGAVLSDTGGWEQGATTYQRVIHDAAGDSAYLRDRGLKPNVLDLARGAKASNVLDVGCGDGWFLDAFEPVRGHECDVTDRAHQTRRWPFSVEDIVGLSFEPESFDLVVASLVLMFVEDLDAACSELFRVATDGGTLVVAITHPSFYRKELRDDPLHA